MRHCDAHHNPPVMLQVAGMPMGNFAIQPGQHGTGHTP